jgi:hypothetical protein
VKVVKRHTQQNRPVSLQPLGHLRVLRPVLQPRAPPPVRIVDLFLPSFVPFGIGAFHANLQPATPHPDDAQQDDGETCKVWLCREHRHGKSGYQRN